MISIGHNTNEWILVCLSNYLNTSGARGVYFEKRSNKWRARLTFKGKIMSFGSFVKFEDAVSARKQAEKIYFGEFLEEKGLELKD